MKTRLIAALIALTPLGACGTVEQVADDRVRSMCSEGGYRLGTPAHEQCVNYLKPTAMVMERQRRQELVSQGVAQISRGLNPPETGPKITCVQTGTITQCY